MIEFLSYLIHYTDVMADTGKRHNEYTIVCGFISVMKCALMKIYYKKKTFPLLYKQAINAVHNITIVLSKFLVHSTHSGVISHF